MNKKPINMALATSIFTVILFFLSVLFISSASAKSNWGQFKADFESFVDNLQIKGLSPFEIAVQAKGQMIQLIQESASKGMTLKEITAVVKTATKGAV
jgi:hypothetical protein